MKKSSITIAPSIMSGDFAKLGEEAKRLADAGADAIHIDIMDGHFVPNLTMGPQAVAAINRSTDLFLDVHLMIYSPDKYIEEFVKSGADRITIHFEATEDVSDTLAFIRRCNVEAGLAFSPETSMSMIPKYLHQCDTLLLMTVHPGFGGQAFIPDVLEKIEFVRNICNQLQLSKGGKTLPPSEPFVPYDIQVDGGINDKTAEQCAAAGANSFVAGTYLFSQSDMRQAISHLRQTISSAQLKG
jgi:ribulose-phosphate 3-epimerase